MITVIAKWYIQEQEAKVVEALAALAKQVEAEEPDTWMYVVHTGASDGSVPPPAAGEVVFVEVYKDHDAFMRHVNGKPFQTFVATYGSMFVQTPPPNQGAFFLVEALDRIGGFVRPEAAGARQATK